MNIIHIIILFPLISCLILLFFKDILSYSQVIAISIGSIFISMLFSVFLVIMFLYQDKNILIEKLWTFIFVDDFKINFGFLLDGLSLTMLIMVVCIGFLVHLFSAWYMHHKNGFSNFFAYMNLFIFNMILLVLSDNLVFMFLGWEGVGLCSYLLVGFYFKNVNFGYAALKGFIVTRVGDIFLLLSIFFIYREFGTTNFEELKLILKTVTVKEHVDFMQWITLFLLIGAIGKSAQIPLHTWLADAMVGPTPVSALIHAATMVTAGVYLITRTFFFFSLCPNILFLLGIIGSFTLIFSSFSALVQSDIKRILAYSTMSQIGYMFISLSMQNWTLTIRHLIVHAIFKALLFLSAGSIIFLLKNEKDIFKMGGLKNQLPFLYISFLIGGASLSSLPLITSGFYSKEDILIFAWENDYIVFFISGLLGLLLTTLYTFRMIFVVFHGKEKRKFQSPKEFSHNFPLIILMIFSTFVESYIVLPLSFVFPKEILFHSNLFLEIVFSSVSLLGIVLSYYLWVVNKTIVNNILCTSIGRFIHSFLFNAWRFDVLYNFMFVKPYFYVAKIFTPDPIDIVFRYPKNLLPILYRRLLSMHNGYLRTYLILVISSCLIFLIAIKLFL
ncbi:MAG: NADH-quinone oxidoreductase subunit L [Buchnera aphidicola (Kaburagia rhusicola ensigallis)]